MWGFRKLCVLEVWPFLILNSCVWARILAQHWSWVVQPCLAPLVRWAKMPWGAEVWNPPVTTFSLEMGPCVHTAKPPEMWPKHHSWSLESWTSKTGSVPWQRRRLQNPAFVSQNQGMPSGLWLPVVLSPRHSSFLLWLLLWVFFRPEVLLLGCSFNAQLYLVGWFFLGAV